MYSPLGSDLVVEAVQLLGGGTVEVEPPVADEVVLVEESPVGAEEAVLGQTSSSVSSADVESLALSLGVGVVTSIHLGENCNLILTSTISRYQEELIRYSAALTGRALIIYRYLHLSPSRCGDSGMF